MNLPAVEERVAETRRAFDGVAEDYDGPLGNNALIQHMRAAAWQAIERNLPPGSALLDLGCGTGLDAVHFAQAGYRVLGVDASGEMVRKTQQAAQWAGVADRVQARQLSLHELDKLAADVGRGGVSPSLRFDGLYSDLGALNCAPDLAALVEPCARLLRPGGKLVVSVINRVCPWELGYYLLHGKVGRARVRFADGPVPVSLNGRQVWTRYVSPAEFERLFAGQFVRRECRALHLFLPPPYLIGPYEHHRGLFRPLAWLDERVAALPGLRQMGDSFLMVLERRG